MNYTIEILQREVNRLKAYKTGGERIQQLILELETAIEALQQIK